MDEFEDAMKSRIKRCTSRNKRYGEPGDTFKKWGAEFELTDVKHFTLHLVADMYYESEGFDRPSEFIKCWEKLHPKKGYEPNKQVWVHFFRKVMK